MISFFCMIDKKITFDVLLAFSCARFFIRNVCQYNFWIDLGLGNVHCTEFTFFNKKRDIESRFLWLFQLTFNSFVIISTRIISRFKVFECEIWSMGWTKIPLEKAIIDCCLKGIICCAKYKSLTSFIGSTFASTFIFIFCFTNIFSIRSQFQIMKLTS